MVTSNRTREVHDALKRRCLYHWVEHPGFEREVAIIRRRLPAVTEALAAGVARVAADLRQEDLLKPPGVAESLDWAEAMLALGARDLDPDLAAASLGAFLKYREDQERVVGRLAAWARGGMTCTAAGADVTATLVGFARTLRAAGVPASPDRVHAMVDRGRAPRRHRDGPTSTGPGGSRCAPSPEDLDRYDRAFAAYFAGEQAPPRRRAAPVEVVSPGRRPGPERAATSRSSSDDAGRGRDGEPDRGAAPPRPGGPDGERAGGRTAADRRDRPGGRVRAGPGGTDRPCAARSTPGVRSASLLRRGGEPARLEHRARRVRPRRLVLVVDVSGSMQPYAEPLLRFAHAAARRRPAHRGLHRRHPADPGLPRDARARPVGGAGRGAPTRCPTGAAGTRLGELLQRRSSTGGGSGAWPGVRWS